MMFVTLKHVFEIKKCRNFLKDNDLRICYDDDDDDVITEFATSCPLLVL